MSFDFNQIEKQHSLSDMLPDYYELVIEGMYTQHRQTDHRNQKFSAMMKEQLEKHCHPELLEELYPNTITFMPYFVKDYVVTSPNKDPKILYGECHNININRMLTPLDHLLRWSNLNPSISLIHEEILKAANFSVHGSFVTVEIYFTPDNGIALARYENNTTVCSLYAFFTGLGNYFE